MSGFVWVSHADILEYQLKKIRVVLHVESDIFWYVPKMREVAMNRCKTAK